MFIAKIDAIGVENFLDQCGADVSSHIEGIEVIKDNLGILLDALRYVCILTLLLLFLHFCTVI